MRHDEFGASCDELKGLIDIGPGLNNASLARVRALVSSIRCDPELSRYAKDKAAEAERDFAMWFSAKRWKKFRDGAQLRAMLYTNIAKLRGVKRRLSLPDM